jgi:hypothetical protein
VLTSEHMSGRILGVSKTANRRKLGWWIKRHAGRIVDGLRFVRASGNRSAEAWQVESVSTVSSVLVAPRAKSVGGDADGGNAYARASRGT